MSLTSGRVGDAQRSSFTCGSVRGVTRSAQMKMSVSKTERGGRRRFEMEGDVNEVRVPEYVGAQRPTRSLFSEEIIARPNSDWKE